MLLTEYEGKCLLRDAGVPVSRGFLARTADAITRRKLTRRAGETKDQLVEAVEELLEKRQKGGRDGDETANS